MRRQILAAAAALSFIADFAPGFVAAQPETSAAIAVLYDQPNFHGRSVRIIGAQSDLARWGFARRAMSAHFDGDWTVCDAPRYGGRCITVTGTQADLLPLGLERQIVSLRQGEAVAEPQADITATIVAAPAPPPPPPADDGYFDRPQRAEAPPPPDAGPPPPPRSWQSAAGPDQGVAGYASVFFGRPREAGAEVQGVGRAAADAFCRDAGLGLALSFDTDGHALRDVLCRRD